MWHIQLTQDKFSKINTTTTANNQIVRRGCVKCEWTLEEEQSAGWWNFCPKCGKKLDDIITSTNQNNVNLVFDTWSNPS